MTPGTIVSVWLYVYTQVVIKFHYCKVEFSLISLLDMEPECFNNHNLTERVP